MLRVAGALCVWCVPVSCLQRVGQDSEAALRGAVEVLITEVFGDTERSLAKVSMVTTRTHTTQPQSSSAASSA